MEFFSPHDNGSDLFFLNKQLQCIQNSIIYYNCIFLNKYNIYVLNIPFYIRYTSYFYLQPLTVLFHQATVYALSSRYITFQKIVN